MNKIQQTIESHSGLVMLLGGAIGLAFPYGSDFPGEIIVAFLAITMFLAFFKIDKPLHAVFSWKIPALYLLRYLLFPIGLWALSLRMAPAYATGFLLLGLCPAAIASPAFVGLYNGNVALAFVLSVLTNVGSVFLIPAAMSLLTHSTQQVSAFSLLKSLAECVLLPGALFLLTRRNRIIKTFAQNKGRMITVVLGSLGIFIALSKKRAFILGHLDEELVLVLAVSLFYIVSAALGYAFKNARKDKKTYGISASFNNIGIGISLAIVYFDERTIALIVVAQILWPILPFVADILLHRQSRKAGLVASN